LCKWLKYRPTNVVPVHTAAQHIQQVVYNYKSTTVLTLVCNPFLPDTCSQDIISAGSR
jgi:hypothetical protein